MMEPDVMLEIPESVIDDVVKALNRAIGIAVAHAPDQVADISAVAVRLDDAIQDATATEP